MLISKAQTYDFGTGSKEALQSYQQGWKEILDLGEWTKAEESFRKAVAIDPNFDLAWAQVGRISNDPEERKEILEKLESMVITSDGWIGRLLEVYLGSLVIIDAKDLGKAVDPKLGKDFIQKLYQTSQEFLKEYPDETYIEAEYIEAIHAIYGGNAALDSISNRGISSKSPFFKSYESMVYAEVEEFESAYESLKELKQMLESKDSPTLPYTEATILEAEGKNEEALVSINQCLELDPKHSLAKRLRAKLLQ